MRCCQCPSCTSESLNYFHILLSGKAFERTTGACYLVQRNSHLTFGISLTDHRRTTSWKLIGFNERRMKLHIKFSQQRKCGIFCAAGFSSSAYVQRVWIFAKKSFYCSLNVLLPRTVVFSSLLTSFITLENTSANTNLFPVNTVYTFYDVYDKSRLKCEGFCCLKTCSSLVKHFFSVYFIYLLHIYRRIIRRLDMISTVHHIYSCAQEWGTRQMAETSRSVSMYKSSSIDDSDKIVAKDLWRDNTMVFKRHL